MFKNALVSTSDKTGLVEFLRHFAGLRIVSTGGTAEHLRQNGFNVIDVSEQTGFPEVMDGRVKTLHPRVHMALLARGSHSGDMKLLAEEKLEPFDLVVGNLYPFEEALAKNLSDEEQIEYIDIGGPSFLRSAAKSFDRIAVVCDPADYAKVIEKKTLTDDDRRWLAAKVFEHVAAYDSMVARHLGGHGERDFALGGKFVSSLRYGENPQQHAGWYRITGAAGGLHQAKIIQGKALSYNNLLDLDAASLAARAFSETCAVVVKHNNPCGMALDESAKTACERAIQADPVSAFGGIVACNRLLDEGAAQCLGGLFLECVVAPDFSSEALKVFSAKKNLRVLRWEKMAERSIDFEVRTIAGGILVQTPDQAEEWSSLWTVLGSGLTPQIQQELVFAWKACTFLKSNSIALTSGQQTVGLGMGQVNRVEAVEQAIARMNRHHPGVRDVVLASDAFFPFADSIELAASQGIRWVIQPGGSVRDDEVQAAAQKLGVNMVLTHQRHFRH